MFFFLVHIIIQHLKISLLCHFIQKIDVFDGIKKYSIFLLISTFKAYNNIFISLVFCILSAFILTTSYGGYYIDFHRVFGKVLILRNSSMKKTPKFYHQNNLRFHSRKIVFSLFFYISDFLKKCISKLAILLFKYCTLTNYNPQLVFFLILK